jgi:hypothetical protein
MMLPPENLANQRCTSSRNILAEMQSLPRQTFVFRKQNFALQLGNMSAIFVKHLNRGKM